MPRFLIELPHEDEREACMKALRAIQEFGSHFVTHADWGCNDGAHACWLMVEVDSRDQAMQMVPPEMRGAARIVQLNRFTREEIAKLIEEL